MQIARAVQERVLLEVRQRLREIDDRDGADAEQLVAAGALHRVDRRERAAPGERERGRVGPRPRVLGDLDLAILGDELVVPGEVGDEARHRHDERRPADRIDERLRAVVAVALGGELDVGLVRRLMAVAEAHERRVRPLVLEEDRDLDHARREVLVGGVADLLLDLAELLDHLARVEHVGIDADHVRRVGGADVDHAVDVERGEMPRDGLRAGVDTDAHRLVELDDDPLVAAERVERRVRGRGGRHPRVTAPTSYPAASAASPTACATPPRSRRHRARRRCALPGERDRAAVVADTRPVAQELRDLCGGELRVGGLLVALDDELAVGRVGQVRVDLLDDLDALGERRRRRRGPLRRAPASRASRRRRTRRCDFATGSATAGSSRRNAKNAPCGLMWCSRMSSAVEEGLQRAGLVGHVRRRVLGA